MTYSFIALQNGTQAIHIAAVAGQLHILKALREQYGVPPDTTDNVSLCYEKDIIYMYIILYMHACIGWVPASPFGSNEGKH